MRKKRLFWQIPFLVFLIIGTVWIVRQQNAMPFQHDKGSIFGTTYHIVYQSEKNFQRDYVSGPDGLKKINAVFSTYDSTSTVSLINRNQPNVNIDDRFMAVYNLACSIAQATDSAFDITVAPLVNAWGFGFKNEHMPSRQQVDSILRFVGMDKFEIKTVETSSSRTRGYFKSDPRLMLDFNAIAKGYGVDVVARFLRLKGIKNFMVEIGGEVVVSGLNEKQKPWKIGVTKPNDDSTGTDKELQTVLNLTDIAMATSGNYRNFYYKGGKKYAHTIDPRTGYPVQHSILSATVLAKDCATADAYATSFMVLGLDKSKAVLAKHPELMAYFIYTDAHGHNAVWLSPALKAKIAP